jgi:hypothetical protein
MSMTKTQPMPPVRPPRQPPSPSQQPLPAKNSFLERNPPMPANGEPGF